MTPGDEAAQWLTGENPDELAVEIELPEWADDELVLLGAAPTLTYQADGQTYSHTFPRTPRRPSCSGPSPMPTSATATHSTAHWSSCAAAAGTWRTGCLLTCGGGRCEDLRRDPGTGHR